MLSGRHVAAPYHEDRPPFRLPKRSHTSAAAPRMIGQGSCGILLATSLALGLSVMAQFATSAAVRPISTWLVPFQRNQMVRLNPLAIAGNTVA